MDVMMKSEKEFLVIGPTTALTYKNIAGYMHDNHVWLGYAKQMKGFRRPDDSLLLSKDKDGSVPL